MSKRIDNELRQWCEACGLHLSPNATLTECPSMPARNARHGRGCYIGRSLPAWQRDGHGHNFSRVNGYGRTRH